MVIEKAIRGKLFPLIIHNLTIAQSFVIRHSENRP